MKGLYAYRVDEPGERLKELVLFPGVLIAGLNNRNVHLQWTKIETLKKTLHEFPKFPGSLRAKGYDTQDFYISNDLTREFIDLCFRDNDEPMILQTAEELVNRVIERVGVKYHSYLNHPDNPWSRRNKLY